jgi:RHS repeat-associated protein
LQNNLVVKQYTYGLDLISQRQSGGVSFYQYDGHGSVRGLSNASGSLTDTYTYDAFGTVLEKTGTTDNNYLYAGEQFDADLGFYYNRARYLNASTGRFISQDSYEGKSIEPLSLHKYAYGNNNTVNRVDPSGNFSLSSAEFAAVAGISSVLSTIALNTFTTLTAINNIEASGGLNSAEGVLLSGRLNTGRFGGTIGAGLDLFFSFAERQIYYSLEGEIGLNPATVATDIKSKYDSQSVGLVWGLNGNVQQLAGLGISASYPIRALPLLRSLVSPKFFSELANFSIFLTVAGNRASGRDTSITFGVSSSGPAIVSLGLRSTSFASLISYNDEFRRVSDLPPAFSNSFSTISGTLDSVGRNPEALAQAVANLLTF